MTSKKIVTSQVHCNPFNVLVYFCSCFVLCCFVFVFVFVFVCSFLLSYLFIYFILLFLQSWLLFHLLGRVPNKWVCSTKRCFFFLSAGQFLGSITQAGLWPVNRMQGMFTPSTPPPAADQRHRGENWCANAHPIWRTTNAAHKHRAISPICRLICDAMMLINPSMVQPWAAGITTLEVAIVIGNFAEVARMNTVNRCRVRERINQDTRTSLLMRESTHIVCWDSFY